MDKLTQLQIDFLNALAKFETRKGNERIIDIDENYLDECIKAASVPLVAINRERAKLLKACKHGQGKGPKGKPSYWQQMVAERCKRDVVFWINNFAYIYNPWLTKYGFPFKLPFVLTPKQQEYMAWRENLYMKNKSGITFKCRDVGVSWCNMAHQAWHWQWEPGFQGRVGSLKGEEVDDKSDPDSLMEKFRTIIYNQPFWMRPRDMKTRDNKYDVKMKIVNPMINSTLTGQMGDYMGRGGRASLYDVDEWAHVMHGRAIDANLSANTYCRIYTGTPMGRNNDYADKVMNNRLPIFEFNYWDDPRKSEDWLENFKEINSESTVQQEVFKSFDAFKTGTYIPGEWVQAAITLWRKITAGEIQPPQGKRIAGMDVAAGGINSSVLVWKDGIVVQEPYEWNVKNTTILAEKAAEICKNNYIEELNFDAIAVGVGVKSTYELMDVPFRPVAVDVRKTASEIPLDGDTKPARNTCANRRAELAERMRRRFERTFEFITQDIKHPLDKMVAIPPNNSKLITQLSVPERLYDNGKYRLEAKEVMARRGEPSPDFFDACAFLEADDTAEMHVISQFNPKKNGIIAEKKISPTTLMMGERCQNYVSVYHSDVMAAAAIGAVWDGIRITIYNEAYLTNASVNRMCGLIKSQFPQNVYEYVGNKLIFSSKEDDLFMQYMTAGILLQENFLYNELSATALLNEFFEQNRIVISKNCTLLLRQLDGFMKMRGMPDYANMEVVMALCNLINRLKEFGKITKNQEPVRQHYQRTTKKLHEQGINARRYYAV